jgi:uncharacterized membrane protein YedE/YeeE
MELTPNVRFARNVVVGMGVFILICGIGMLITEPTKWQDYLMMLGGSAFAFGVVRQVNCGEGGWSYLVGLRHPTSSDRSGQADAPADTCTRE